MKFFAVVTIDGKARRTKTVDLAEGGAFRVPLPGGDVLFVCPNEDLADVTEDVDRLSQKIRDILRRHGRQN